MAKKAYHLATGAVSFMTTVNNDGKQVVLTPDKPSYETDDPIEQDVLDAAVAQADSSLNAGKK